MYQSQVTVREDWFAEFIHIILNFYRENSLSPLNHRSWLLVSVEFLASSISQMSFSASLPYPYYNDRCKHKQCFSKKLIFCYRSNVSQDSCGITCFLYLEQCITSKKFSVNCFCLTIRVSTCACSNIPVIGSNSSRQ